MTVIPGRRRPAIRGAIAAMATIALCGGVVALASTAATAAPAKSVGYVRLAHLSPDTPQVDVYLDSLSSNMKQQVFKGVGYGTLSNYLPLPAGTYAVSMRGSGAPATSKPVLTTNVTVVSGKAYTVAGVGRYADLGLKIIPDDLVSPMDGKAKVRIVQASIKAPLLDVSVDGGKAIADQVPFATTTAYHLVDPGVLTIRVSPSAGGASALLHVTLNANAVYSVLVLDGKTALTAQLRVDAAGAGAVPTGGIETGAGGTATHRTTDTASTAIAGKSGTDTLVASALMVVAVALGGTAFLVARRRPRLAVWGATTRSGKTSGRDGSSRTL